MKMYKKTHLLQHFRFRFIHFYTYKSFDYRFLTFGIPLASTMAEQPLRHRACRGAEPNRRLGPTGRSLVKVHERRAFRCQMESDCELQIENEASGKKFHGACDTERILP
jgi:hypothetical protein